VTESSFWEKLGRGVGFGWQKAKQWGAQVGEGIESSQELEKARRELALAYGKLGEAVARRLLDGAPAALSPDDPEIAGLLAAAAKARSDLDRCEAAERVQDSVADERQKPSDPDARRD
jgi:hypothetical protein